MTHDKPKSIRETATSLPGYTPRGGFTDAQLDAEWTDLIAKSDDMAMSLHANYNRAMEEVKNCLGELRDLARMSLTEKREKELRARGEETLAERFARLDQTKQPEGGCEPPSNF